MRAHWARPLIWIGIVYWASTSDYPCYLRGADKRETIAMMVTAGKLLEERGVHYSLHEGTTLGACRDHDIFPSDTDADLLLDPSFVFNKEKEFQAELCRIGGLELKDGTDYVLWPKGTNQLSRSWWGQVLICLRHSQCKVPSLDINSDAGDEVKTGHDGTQTVAVDYSFFKDRYHWPPVKNERTCFIPNALILGLPEEHVFPVANHPEKYLEKVYGPEWRIHTPHFAIRLCEIFIRFLVPLFTLIHIVLVPIGLVWVHNQRHLTKPDNGNNRSVPWRNAFGAHCLTFVICLVLVLMLVYFKVKAENPYKFKRIVLGESDYNF